MLNFNVDNLRSVYVYILKVTTDYVYVTTTRAGQPYKQNSSVQDVYKEHTISKIRIHRSVSHAYSTFYATREFAEPHLASLNYYDNDIVSIEIQMVNKRVKGYQTAENWQSFFSQVIPKLALEIKDKGDVWINGTELFWFKEDDSSESDVALTSGKTSRWVQDENGDLKRRIRTEYKLDEKGFLTIQSVSFVRLGSMGLSILAAINSQKEIEAQNTNDTSMLYDIENNAMLKIETGKVLAFYPNADDPESESITVYSPVLQQKKLNDSYKASSDKDYTPDEERKVYNLSSTENKVYANIDFAIKAANTIGKLYGYEHTDHIDIQRIIRETGEVSLLNIDENSRRCMPIHMDAMTCLAYLFRFIYAEKDLNKMRELSKMFRFCINKGLVYESDINSDFIDGVASEVPLGPRIRTKSELLNDLKGIIPDNSKEVGKVA